MVEKISGLQGLPNGPTFELPKDGNFDPAIAKYGKSGYDIKRSSEKDFGDLLSYIYASGKRESGLGMKEASKDVAKLVDFLKADKLTVSSLNVASEHGDTANAVSIAKKMATEELAKYSGEDRAILVVKNKRLEEAKLSGAVQTQNPDKLNKQPERLI